MDFGITSLFITAEVKPPTRATCESLQCRAWTQFDRCDRIKEQHDGTCWEHRDYYNGWWSRHVPTNDYTEDIIMMNKLAEMRFQIENGFVSLLDPELDEALRRWTKCEQFFMFLCEYDQFNYSAYPGHVSAMVYRLTKMIINRIQTYDKAFESLHRLFDRGYIFTHYLMHALNWLNHNALGSIGPANVFEGLLYTANITFRDIAGKRQLLAETIRVLRNPYIVSEIEDDRYNFCIGRFWLWTYNLKEAERAAYEPIRESVLAAAWAPVRLPFWCLDIEEMAEEYSDGLPSKEEWKALCAAC